MASALLVISLVGITALSSQLIPTLQAQLVAMQHSPTPTPSPTPNMTQTAAQIYANATATNWNMTVTAASWTRTPTPTNTPSPLPTRTPLPSATPLPPTPTLSPTPIPTLPPTNTATPAAVAALRETGSSSAPPPAAGPSDGLAGLLIGFSLASILGFSGAAFVYYRARQRTEDAVLPAQPRPHARTRTPRHIEPLTHDALVAEGTPPRLAAALVRDWGSEAPIPPLSRYSTASPHRTLWRKVVLATLDERGMLRHTGEDTPPPAAQPILARDRVIFILDMAQLGGVRWEQWLDPHFIEQMRAASGGCRVVVSGEGGLAIQISRMPEPVEAAPDDEETALPRFAPLNLSARPRAPYAVGIGATQRGPLWVPLAQLGHIMVSGATGSGKSYFLRALVYQLTSLPASQPITLYLADRAGSVFTPLAAYNVPHLAHPVAKTPEDMNALLESAIAEMARRERLFDAQTGHFPDKLEEYNRIDGVERLPRAVVVVDEVTVLVAETGGERGEVHSALLALAAQGRKYGFTLVAAGQDFKATTFNTALTHQLSTRVAFKAGSANESRVVLGADGAEALRGEGHGLLRLAGRLIEFQGFAVDKADFIAHCAAAGSTGAPQLPPSPTREDGSQKRAESLPGPLSDWERELVRCAVARFDGAFTKRKLAGIFGQDRQYEIRKLAERWEAEGLLVRERRPGFRNEMRWVTPRLARMAEGEEETRFSNPT